MVVWVVLLVGEACTGSQPVSGAARAWVFRPPKHYSCFFVALFLVPLPTTFLLTFVLAFYFAACFAPAPYSASSFYTSRLPSFLCRKLLPVLNFVRFV